MKKGFLIIVFNWNT